MSINTHDKFSKLLSSAVGSFYEAKAKNKKKDKLFLKGVAEGMMRVMREADLLSLDEVNSIVETAKLNHTVSQEQSQDAGQDDIDTPTYIRLGVDVNRHFSED